MGAWTGREQTTVNMSTKRSSTPLENAIAGLPDDFRKRIAKTYADLKSAFQDSQHELCGLRGGKFAETVLRYLQESLTGTHVSFGQSIRNFAEECDKLERLPKSSGTESFRILIPRALRFLYTLRNKRDIGHVGGDVDANKIDAATCVRVADWCMCEILRVVHTLSLEDAQALLDSIAVRQTALVWDVQGKKRLLIRGLDYRSQVLVFLHAQSADGVPIEDLFSWTEHSNKSNFRTAVIGGLHEQRLVEYDRDTDFVFISPIGVARVEDDILPKLNGTVR